MVPNIGRNHSLAIYAYFIKTKCLLIFIKKLNPTLNKHDLTIRKNLLEITKSECSIVNKFTLSVKSNENSTKYDNLKKSNEDTQIEDELLHPERILCDPEFQEQKELERTKLILKKKLYKKPNKNDVFIEKRRTNSCDGSFAFL